MPVVLTCKTGEESRGAGAQGPSYPPPLPLLLPPAESEAESPSCSFINTGKKLKQPLSCITRIKGCVMSLAGFHTVPSTFQRQCLARALYF